MDELRLLPEDKLNSAAALVDRTLGTYNGVDIILQGHLSSNVSRVQLTKSLRKIVLLDLLYTQGLIDYSDINPSHG